MRTVGIVVNVHKELAHSQVGELIDWLESRQIGIKILEEDAELVGRPDLISPPEDLKRLCDLVIALGGDGTLLRAARLIGEKGIPILGVNLGSLGFLTEIVVEELYTALEGTLAGRFMVQERMTLEASLRSEEYHVTALNDVVISMGASCRMLVLTVYLGDEYVCSYSADGVIVATPTGSTAYSLAAGGPIVHPTMRALIISPICPHSLGVRPMIVSPDDAIRVDLEPEGGDAVLTADGQVRYPLAEGESIVLRKGRYPVRLIVSPSRSFYEILKTKLRWGGKWER